jgi:hypothetical protein
LTTTVQSKKSVKLELEKEAFAGGADLWILGGSVLEAWLKAGCPDFSAGPDVPAASENPPPSPSPIACETLGQQSSKCLTSPRTAVSGWSRAEHPEP